MEDGRMKKKGLNSWFFWRKVKSSFSSSLPNQTFDEESAAALLGSASTAEKRHAGWKAMPFILGNETFERLASFGLMANFMLYLVKEYHMDHVQAATILNSWSGASNFASIIGAYIADAYLGKFWTLVFGSLSSLLGMLIMTSTAVVPALRPSPCTLDEQHSVCKDSTTIQIGVLILSLCWLSIGTGGIKPCSIPFSVDQFDLTTEEGRKGTNSFFNLYYASQAIVVVVAQVIIVYIQDKVSWAIGFGVPTFAMLSAIILFLVGSKIYVIVKPKGTIFSGIAQVFVAAYKKRNLYFPNEEHDSRFYDSPLKSSLQSKLTLSKQYRCLNKAALIMDGELDSDGSLMNPWRLSSVQQVEDVKCLLNIIPIWLTSILGFLSVYQQGTFNVVQAMKMDLRFPFNIQIPVGSIGVITMVSVIICLPLYDRLLVPALEKFRKQEGGFTLLQRVGIGLMFSVLNLLVSGIVERKRRELAISCGSPDGVAPMSVMWLAPQLILLAFSEVFSMVGLIEFYNKQFPDHMRSIGNSLLYLSLSLSSYTNSFVINVVHKVTEESGSNWWTEDVNSSKLDMFYFLMAGLSFSNFVFFLCCARRYNYRQNLS